MTGVPTVMVSHRKREFLETAVNSMHLYLNGIGEGVVVDDSGDADHHQWMLHQGYTLLRSSPDGEHVGYLGAMQTAWEAMRRMCRSTGSDYALLWEEDFTLTQPVHVADMIQIMTDNPRLAQLNLQRQAVYGVERRFGYMQSHQRRGYMLTPHEGWVERARPFTTNPCMIRREVLDIDWPSRVECDATPGGAEPAMSKRLEEAGYTFGWLGKKNTPQTHHIGAEMKTGHGY